MADQSSNKENISHQPASDGVFHPTPAEWTQPTALNDNEADREVTVASIYAFLRADFEKMWQKQAELEAFERTLQGREQSLQEREQNFAQEKQQFRQEKEQVKRDARELREEKERKDAATQRQVADIVKEYEDLDEVTHPTHDLGVPAHANAPTTRSRSKRLASTAENHPPAANTLSATARRVSSFGTSTGGNPMRGHKRSAERIDEDSQKDPEASGGDEELSPRRLRGKSIRRVSRTENLRR
ncbi:hypothetical protein Q7P37_002328 [Cladosporium fusiforme]